MTTFIWILLAVGIGYGAFWLMKHRGKRETDRQDRADKRARSAREDAKAMQRTLNGRR